MSQLIIPCDTGDCYCNSNLIFENATTDVYVSGESNGRAWFPFTVPLPRLTVIEQAYITYRCVSTSNADSEVIRFHCEAADDVVDPTSQSDLYNRPLGSYYTDESVSQYVTNTEYTYQIDNQISEVIERSGWQSGTRLAVIVRHLTSVRPRRVYSADYSSGIYAAYLTLNFHTYVPRALGML